MKVFAIDPGTANLGWVFMEDGDILDAGVDHVWTYETPIHPSINEAMVGWFRAKLEQLRSADRILIEHQYTTKGAVSAFLPLLVMEILCTLVMYEYPGKLVLVHPAGLKKFYEIRGTYAERKNQVVRLAGLSHLAGRVHDIADCVLMVDYWLKQNASPEVARKQAQKQQKLRAKLMAQHSPKSEDSENTPSESPHLSPELRIRDESPPRRPVDRSCAKCKTSHSSRWYKMGLLYQCTSCYYRQWQRERRGKKLKHHAL
jgi:hypothetical protein